VGAILPPKSFGTTTEDSMDYASRHHPQVVARKVGRLNLHDYRSLAYRRALQADGVAIPANVTKAWLFGKVVERGIDMTSFQGRYL
jgi:hypothetical protein